MKISIDIQLPNPNFNLYKLQKIAISFVNQSPTPTQGGIMWALTGDWLIVDISFLYKGGSVKQIIKAIKRELSLSPEDIQNLPPQEESNQNKNNDGNRGDNENPTDLSNTDVAEVSKEEPKPNNPTEDPTTPTEYDLDYVVGNDGGKLSHGLMDNSKRTPILAVVDGQPIEEKTAIAFMKMRDAAKKDGITISVNSGFRPAFGANLKGKTLKGKQITITTQESIRRDKSRWKKGSYTAKDDDDFVFNAPASAYNPATAAPGKSNHGSGFALDLSTGSRISFNKVLRNNAYEWLVKNSWKFGFVRGVNSEEWHFEYRPDIANKGPYAKVPKTGNVQGDPNNLFYGDLGLNNLCAC
jgi:LAS superfamily LD-carboxypeptidase LdcB